MPGSFSLPPLLPTILQKKFSLLSTRIQKFFAARRQRREANTALLAQQEATNAARIAALQANTCFCSSSDWDGRSHNDGCARAAAAARERERAASNNEVAGNGAEGAQTPIVEQSRRGFVDIEEVEPDGPPPEYMLVDEHGQTMMDEHGRKQRWQGRGLRALFQRRRWGGEDLVRVE